MKCGGFKMSFLRASNGMQKEQATLYSNQSIENENKA